MAPKREVLGLLSREELVAVVDQFALEVRDRRKRDDLVEAVAVSKKATLGEVLPGLPRDRLKKLCRQLGLDDGGREKTGLVERLVGGKAESPESTPGAPRTTVKTSEPSAVAPTNGNGRQFGSFSEVTAFIWSVADLLRGDYKQADYGKVILPFTVLRRLDCVLRDTKAKVLDKYEALKGGQLKNLDAPLNRVAGVSFHNISKLDFVRLKGDPDHIAHNLNSYIKGFSEGAREILERFKFAEQIAKLDESNLLYQVVCKFAEVDLHPASVPNHVMGSIFEELIRRFSELSNETAGEHFTPREVIRLMVNLLFVEDDDALRRPGVVRTLYDPAAGTGGMLSVAEEYLRELNPDARLEVFGQELNDESFAICKSDMMIKGQNPENIKRGNSFSEDGHPNGKFDYLLSNPPFGVEWKKVEKAVRDEHEQQGHAGRFGPGLPRINDGSLLFLLHMMSKMKPTQNGEQGTRLAIVLNGSPLFTGDAGSGESEIRRWVVENDMLEAIIGLPTDMFYNTGISTYIWVVTNRKPKHRRGKVQLINGTTYFKKMRKSLGNKRAELGPDHIAELTRIFGDFEESKVSKIFNNADFGFRRITVERPLRLNCQASPERLERLTEETGFQNLASSKKKGAAGIREVEEGRQAQQAILQGLRMVDPQTVYRSRRLFEEALDGVLDGVGVKVSAPARKAILSALSERDEEADVCTDSRGSPEPDADLRDAENVPLKEDIHVYFDREVKPHVPDAWIDEEKTKVGYEIPFTRHFYEYKPLRPLEVIEDEMRCWTSHHPLDGCRFVTAVLSGIACGHILWTAGVEHTRLGLGFAHHDVGLLAHLLPVLRWVLCETRFDPTRVDGFFSWLPSDFDDTVN